MNKERFEKLINAVAMETAIHILNAYNAGALPTDDDEKVKFVAILRIVAGWDTPKQDEYMSVIQAQIGKIDPFSEVDYHLLANRYVREDWWKEVLVEKRLGIMGWLPPQNALVNKIREIAHDMWKKSGGNPISEYEVKK